MKHNLEDPQDLFSYAASKIIQEPEGIELEENHGNNQRGENLRIKAEEWIQDNPRLYELFKDYARQIYQSGQSFSVKLIAERVRWEVRVNWNGEFKVSNDLVAYIGRKLASDIPELKTIFKFKKTRW
jgi:hypothetical protein